MCAPPPIIDLRLRLKLWFRFATVAPQGLGGPSIIASDLVYPFGIASLNDRSSQLTPSAKVRFLTLPARS